jgi:TusA-related sulfurtransferase
MHGMKETVETSRELDLRGEVCPYTFVKTTLALEEMEPGQVLEVTVDHAPAVENVPRSVSNRGHEVLDVQQVTDSNWLIRVRKGDKE